MAGLYQEAFSLATVLRIIIIWYRNEPPSTPTPPVRPFAKETRTMNALLVGADRLGNIPAVLAEFGIRIGGHVTGRQPGHQKRATVPAGTQLVILFTDFLGHNVMRSFRDTARAQGLPVVCCRRSTSSLRQTIAASFGPRAGA
jgi:hypothetical protein